MYSGLLSVPGTYLSHSLVYKHLYSVARIPELRLLLFPIPLVSLVLSFSLLVTRFPDPEIPESGNSHTLSNSEICQEFPIPNMPNTHTHIASPSNNASDHHHRPHQPYPGKLPPSSSSQPVRIRSTVLTQPGTPVSFRGMCICLLFDFWKLRKFQCFPFLENSGTPMFLISGNSGLQHFLLLVIRSCISPFTCDSVVSPCFMLLFSLMYSGLSLYPVHTYPTP